MRYEFVLFIIIAVIAAWTSMLYWLLGRLA
jgi:hypothetical protein